MHGAFAKLLRPQLWAVTLGAIGFACGFFGPITFSPEANQGPLLGIFITGPIGFVLGLVLGLLVIFIKPLFPYRHPIFITTAVLLAGTTLYFSFPEPKYIGRIIDASVEQCLPATANVEKSIVYWNGRIAAASWAKTRPHWQENLKELATTADGVVLEMRVQRGQRLYENRKPWNKGTIFHQPWENREETQQYYSREFGNTCEGYVRGENRVYLPVAEKDPPAAWPPATLPNLLNLMVLAPVPTQLR